MRFLERRDGIPFFWLADTAWELLHRLDREETIYYLEDRASKGFTVVQCAILAELDGLRTPNAYGEIPLVDLDPERPNEKYFLHVDWVIHEARRLGMYVALLPTWGDKVICKYDWAKGPEIFNKFNATRYGAFLGRRYKEAENIVWIIGGDRDPDATTVSIWRALAHGVVSGSGGKLNTTMSFHPQPFGNKSSSRWFHNDEWLDFNMLQTGHDLDQDNYRNISEDYKRLPTKPVIDGEPLYEAHGLSFKADELGYSTDADVRKYAYWSLFAGAFGVTYGCHSVWQFYERTKEPVNKPLYEWQEALHLSGASQMSHVKALMLSRPLASRIPDQSILLQQEFHPGNYVAATRDKNGTYAMIYASVGQSFSINTPAIRGAHINFKWFSPRDGTYTLATKLLKSPVIKFTPPSAGRGNDWVLIVEEDIEPANNGNYGAV